MLRKLIGASFVLLLSVGIGGADEIQAIISKVDQKKMTVTFKEFKPKNDRGPEQTLPADPDNVFWAKINWDTCKTERGDKCEGGLKNRFFGKIREVGGDGLAALVITDKDNKKVTELRIFPLNKK